MTSRIPEKSNLHGSLETSLSKSAVADLFSKHGWQVRKATWEDLEVRCAWAELAIEGSSPLLLHGPVADIELNSSAISKILMDAQVHHRLECYRDDGSLLKQLSWPAA